MSVNTEIILKFCAFRRNYQNRRQHIVLVHDNQTPQTINNEDENRVIRCFTTENPVIPDVVFMSPISETDSSSEGYWSGSSWTSSSSWRSYDSMRDDLPTLFDTPIQSISQFLLPEGTGQRSRGLSQSHLSSEFCNKSNPVFGELIRKWSKERMKQVFTKQPAKSIRPETMALNNIICEIIDFINTYIHTY